MFSCALIISPESFSFQGMSWKQAVVLLTYWWHVFFNEHLYTSVASSILCICICLSLWLIFTHLIILDIKKDSCSCTFLTKLHAIKLNLRKKDVFFLYISQWKYISETNINCLFLLVVYRKLRACLKLPAEQTEPFIQLHPLRFCRQKVVYNV